MSHRCWATRSLVRVAACVAVLPGVIVFGLDSVCDVGSVSALCQTVSDNVRHGATMLQQHSLAGDYCLGIVTGDGDSNAGSLIADVFSESGEKLHHIDQFCTGIVYHKCFTDPPKKIMVQNMKKDAWAGSMILTYDGGESIRFGNCLDCDNGSGKVGRIVVDGNDDGKNQGSLACLNKDMCTVSFAQVGSPKFCVMIETGDETHNTGQLVFDVFYPVTNEILDHHEGLYSEAKHKYDKVYHKCLDVAPNIYVQNPTHDGWAGSFKLSYGGEPWREGRCLDCTEGTGKDGRIVVDGNDDGHNQASAACLNGTTCRITFWGQS